MIEMIKLFIITLILSIPAYSFYTMFRSLKGIAAKVGQDESLKKTERRLIGMFYMVLILFFAVIGFVIKNLALKPGESNFCAIQRAP